MLVKLSSDEEPLTISEEIVHQFRLVEGVVLTSSQVEMLIDESELYQCDQRAARVLTIRGHSVGELRRKLSMKGFREEIIGKVMQKYRRNGILDDAQYAYSVAQRLVERKPCGRSYLIAYLRKKLLDRDTAEMTAEMVLSQTDESCRAQEALEKRWSQFSQFDLETARKKSYNYLVRRGFGYDAAKKAFEALINQKNEVT